VSFQPEDSTLVVWFRAAQRCGLRCQSSRRPGEIRFCLLRRRTAWEWGRCNAQYQLMQLLRRSAVKVTEHLSRSDSRQWWTSPGSMSIRASSPAGQCQWQRLCDLSAAESRHLPMGGGFSGRSVLRDPTATGSSVPSFQEHAVVQQLSVQFAGPDRRPAQSQRRMWTRR